MRNIFHRPICAAVMTAALGAVLNAGCSAPIQHQQPVELPAKGKVQLGLGAGLAVSTSALDILAAGKDKAQSIVQSQYQCDAGDRSDCFPATELREVVDAVYGAGMSAPLAGITTIGGAYGLSDRVALAAQYGGGVKLQALVQLHDGGPAKTGWLSSLALGWSRQSTAAPGVLGELAGLVKLDDYVRHNFHVSWAAGKRLREYGWAQFGAHYVLSRYAIDLRPELPLLDNLGGSQSVETVILDRIPRTDETGWSHHAGAFASVWGGYKYAWIGLELAAAWYTTTVAVLGKDTTYSGVAITPTVNLLTRF